MVLGCPAPGSATAALVDHTAAALRSWGHGVVVVAVRDLPAVAVLCGDRGEPALASAIARVCSADGVVIATAVHRAAHAGLVKSLLDLLPRGSLTGVPVLPLATGGAQGGRVAIEYALRPLLQALGATRVLPGRFVPEAMVGGGGPGELAAARVGEALEALSLAVDRDTRRRRRPTG